jgi:hypothetical protein
MGYNNPVVKQQLENEMTYADLFKKLSAMTDAQRLQTVTIHSGIDDEFFAVDSFLISDSSNDVLDPGHFYMEFN